MKDWEKPSLIVIVRSKPEEAVLTGCKIANEGSPDPTTNVTGCHEVT